jgi:hypothetical protein
MGYEVFTTRTMFDQGLGEMNDKSSMSHLMGMHYLYYSRDWLIVTLLGSAKREKRLQENEWEVFSYENKSIQQELNLSGSYQQGYSAAYNTPLYIQVVCKGFYISNIWNYHSLKDTQPFRYAPKTA